MGEKPRRLGNARSRGLEGGESGVVFNKREVSESSADIYAVTCECVCARFGNVQIRVEEKQSAVQGSSMWPV